VAGAGGRVGGDRSDHHIQQMSLTDEETLALVNLLERTIRDDPYPLSPRVRMLKAILDKLVEPRPGGEPLPPLRNYEPPRMGRYRRRRG
jgi:hypothetical protein